MSTGSDRSVDGGTGTPDAPGGGGRRRFAPAALLALVAGAVVVATPVVAAAVAWRRGWMPYGDEAAVTAQSWGSLGAHPPLVGIYSSATSATGSEQILYHPGPLQLWLLAPVIHLFAPSNGGALLASGLLVAASFAVVLTVAWRRGGTTFVLPVAVVAAWWMHAAGAQAIRSPYADSLGAFMLAAFLAAAWAVLDRDEWFWPVAVVAASIAAQAQVAYLVPVAVVSVVVVAQRTWWWWRGRRMDVPAADGHGHRRPRRIAFVSVVALLGCWSGPLYDQFFGRGNLAKLIAAGGTDAVGLRWGLNRLVDALAFPPAWAKDGVRVHATVVGDNRIVFHNTAWEYVSAAVFAGLWVWAFWWTVRRHERRLTTLGSVVLAGLVAATGATSVMPSDPISLIGHLRIWDVMGVFVWSFPLLVIVDAAVAVVRDPGRARTVGARLQCATVAVGVVALLVPLVLVVRRSSPAFDSSSSGYGVVWQFTRAGKRVCERGRGPVLVIGNGPTTKLPTLGLVAQLQLEGCPVHVSDELRLELPGDWFGATGDETASLLVSQSPTPPRGFRRLSTYDPRRPPEPYRGFDTVYLLMQTEASNYLYVRGA